MTLPTTWNGVALLSQKVLGRIRRRLVTLPDSPRVDIVNGSVRFEQKRLPFLDEGDFRAMLTQSYDLSLCDYMRRNLKQGDIVMDIGSNVGYVAAFAASCVGPSGEVHGFEPLAECFTRLERLRELNPQRKLIFNNLALADKDGVLPIAYNPEGDSRNASLVPGKSGAVTREVPVRRLDRYIKDNIGSPERIKLIKVDVEGFEYAVLRGLSDMFAETTLRPDIICEIKPWEVAKLGVTLEEFGAYLASAGYSSFDMITGRPVHVRDLRDMETLIFKAAAAC